MTMTNEELQALKDAHDKLCDTIADLLKNLQDAKAVEAIEDSRLKGQTTLSIVNTGLYLGEFSIMFSKVFNELSKEAGSDVTIDPQFENKDLDEMRAIGAALTILINVADREE